MPPEPSILHAPAARSALVRGVDRMAALLRPTLGPLARTVAIAPELASRPPEVLDDGATITRRTAQLSHPFEDMGGQLVRQLTQSVRERAGDGTATAAVLAQGLLRGADTYVAAGGDPMALSLALGRGLAVVEAALRRQARPIDLPAEIAAVVADVVREPRLAETVGEVVDAVGPDGAALVELTHAAETTHEYVDGVRWNEGYVSHFLLRDGETQARLTTPRVLVTDRPLATADDLLPAVEACVAAGEQSLFVVAPEVRDSALALLILNREKGVLADAVAVRAPGIGDQRPGILRDIAIATGGRCLSHETGDTPANVGLDDLGTAHQAWATRFAFGLLGGRGDKAAIRQRIAELRAELRSATDAYARDKLKERIGKLAGTTAIVWIGGASDRDRDERKARVETGLAAARGAVEHGVVAGGGAALVACVPALSAIGCSEAEGVARRLLAEALAEPMRAIAANAGNAPGPIVSEALRRGPSWTFDVVRGEWVDAEHAGVADPLPVPLAAIGASVSAARMALTTDVLIHRRRPPVSIEP